MKEIRTSGPLMFSDPNCPTRVGEIINTISEIYDIPNPSEGMQVYVRDEKKTYTITGLKEAVIGGERVPDAKVDTFEAVKSQVEEINNDVAEMREALINGSLVVGIANAVKAGAITFDMLDRHLKLSASVVDDLKTADALKPLSANQGKILKELIDIINGTGEGSTDKKITDAIAKLVDKAPENLDTLKELAEWIKDHGTEAAEMLAAINANTTAIETEAERATEAESDIKASAISKEVFEAFPTTSTLELGYQTLAGEELSVEFPPATTKMAGVMSAADKVKLNASIKNVDVSPNADDVELDLEDNTGSTTHVVFPAATEHTAGVMSAADKEKLDNLSEGGGGGVAELMEEVTYSELVALRDKARLVPGMKYRITDYVTTTVQKDTKSANHPFDVIVEAISKNELSELAQAIQHEGDTYFEGNDLGAWQLWYDLNNDTSKYEWADSTNGKGVIYRMIDEKRNDCPYDFKNIQFIRYELNAPDVGGYTYEWQNKMSENINKMFEKNQLSYIWHGNNNEDDYYWEDDMSEVISSPTGETKAFFTFSNVINDVVTDKSITSVCYSNIIKESRDGSQLKLNNIVFFSININNSCNYNSFGNNCYSNSFGNNCYSNSFGNNCNSNSFGNNCNYNSFGNNCNYNSFGNNCYSNSFGNNCYSNSFGNNCYSNSFGNNYNYNSFGNNCNYNSFGDDCYSNSFGDDCYSNSFGDDCYYNSFGNNCNSNSFGNNCNSNSFGNNCNYNSFGNSCNYNSFRDGPSYAFNEDYWEYSYDDELIDGVRGNKFGDRCQNLLIHTLATTGEENSIQNLNIAQGLCSIELDDNDIFIPLSIEIDIVGQSHELKIGRDSNDEIKVYCEADLV